MTRKHLVVVLGQQVAEGKDRETTCSDSRSRSGSGEKTGKILVVIPGQQP